MAIIALAALLGAAACGQCISHKDSQQLEWRVLRQKAKACVDSGSDSEDLKSLENTALHSVPEKGQLDDYCWFLLYRAQMRQKAESADPYPFLLRVDDSLQTSGPTPERTRLGEELASGYMAIHLPRRAVKVLESIDGAQRSPDANIQVEVLRKCIRIVRADAELAGMPRFQEGKDDLETRLWELLGVQPENPWYDEYSLAKDGSRREPEESSDSEKPPSIFLLQPLYQSRPVHIGDDEEEGHEFPLTTSTLTASGEADLDRLLTGLQSGLYRPDGLNLSRAVADLGRKVLASVGKEVRGRPSTSARAFSRGILFGLGPDKATSGDLSGAAYDIAVVFRAAKDTPATVFTLNSIEVPDVRLLDVTGDGIEDLVVQVKEGSGGFLTAAVIDLLHRRTVWQVIEVYRGSVAFVNLDRDPALEILVTMAIDNRHHPCNMCPAPLEFNVYNLDTERLKFFIVGSSRTGAEYLVGNTSMGLTGMTAEMDLSRESQDLADALTRLQSNSALQTSLPGDFKFFLNHYRLLIVASRYGEAADFMAHLASYMPTKPTNPVLDEIRLETLLRRAEASLLASRYSECQRVCVELERMIPGEAPSRAQKEFLGNLLNLRGLAALFIGDFGDSYRSFSMSRKQVEMPGATIEGNLALYFQFLGDPISGYPTAVRALDLAVREKASDKAAVSMLHLAAFSSRLGRPTEAADWLARALRVDRSLSQGANASVCLQRAAEIALENRLPRVAVALLNEAVGLSDELSWQEDGASLLLLYGRALRELKHPELARGVLEASARLSIRLRQSVYAGALYELSLLADELNDPDGRLQLARDAFHAILSGRRRVGEESHKFSYLLNNQEIADWFFAQSIKSGVRAGPLLEEVESWKAQVFRDFYSGGEQLDGTFNRSADQVLRSHLSEGDLLLEYQLGRNTSFVLAATIHPPAVVRILNLRPNQAGSLVERIRKHMNLRDPHMLADIRKNVVSEDLRNLLRNAYAELLGPLKLGNGIRRLIIVTDESLLGMPWSALEASPGQPIASRWDVVLIPSILQMAGSLEGRRSPGNGLRKGVLVAALEAVAGTELPVGVQEGSSRNSTPALPALRAGLHEARSVAEAFPVDSIEYYLDTTTMRRWNPAKLNRATPGNVLNSLREANVAHIIAHGFFDRLLPLQSGLVLAQGEKSRILSAADFLGQRLDKLDIVSLAGCETALGQPMPGGESIGLVRGLLSARVASVAVAEWEIDDSTTAGFFTDFYRGLGNKAKSAAFRAAQNSVRQHSPHPFFWAAYTLYGSWK